MTLQLSLTAAEVRRHDHNHFVASLFALSERREDLFIVYTFFVVLTRIGEVLRELLTAHIRLQWWCKA